jgi:uncharacterized protein
MKNVYLLIVATFLSFGTFAQERNPYPRTITVSGSAEREVTPDEIFVQVHLKEYEKKGGGKVAIDKIRQNFLTAVRTLGLPDSAVTVSRYDANNYNPWWRKKAKKEELFASISYQVMLRSAAQVDQLVDKLDDAATQNFYVSRTSHSKLEELKTALKIEAVKAAKEKATSLAGAVDENIGVAVTINEPNDYYQPYYNDMASTRMMKAEVAQASAPEQPQADFKKMKLRYDVTVVFALK